MVAMFFDQIWWFFDMLIIRQVEKDPCQKNLKIGQIKKKISIWVCWRHMVIYDNDQFFFRFWKHGIRGLFKANFWNGQIFFRFIPFLAKKLLSENHRRSHSMGIIDFYDPYFLTNDEFWYRYQQNWSICSKVTLFLRYWMFHGFDSSAVIATFCINILGQFCAFQCPQWFFETHEGSLQFNHEIS